MNSFHINRHSHVLPRGTILVQPSEHTTDIINVCRHWNMCLCFSIPKLKMTEFSLVISKILSNSENSMKTKGIDFIVAGVCVCVCMHIFLYNSVFSLARKRCSTNHLLTMWLATWARDGSPEVFSLINSITVAKINAIKQRKWECPPCRPLTCGPRTGPPRGENSWGCQDSRSRNAATRVAEDSRLASRSLAAPQPDYKFLKGVEHILYIFSVTIWNRERKKKSFELAAPPEAEECYPPPFPSSLLPYNHKRNTFRNSF